MGCQLGATDINKDIKVLTNPIKGEKKKLLLSIVLVLQKRFLTLIRRTPFPPYSSRVCLSTFQCCLAAEDTQYTRPSVKQVPCGATFGVIQRQACHFDARVKQGCKGFGLHVNETQTAWKQTLNGVRQFPCVFPLRVIWVLGTKS